MRGGGFQNQREHLKILTNYVVVHPTAVSEKYSLSGMLAILKRIMKGIFPVKT